MKNDPKKVFIPFQKWTQLKNETHICVESKKRALSLHAPTLNYRHEIISKETSKPSDVPTTSDIQNVIDRTSTVLQKQKILPTELRRSMFLSNILTENDNQMEFVRVIRQLDEEKENAEKDRLRKQENDYHNVKQLNRKSAAQKKLLLKRSLLDELQKIKVRKQELRQIEMKNEIDELQYMADKLRESQQQINTQEIQKKKWLNKMFSQDLHQKQEYQKFQLDIGRYECKCVLSPKKEKYMKKDSLDLCKELQDSRKTTLTTIPEPIIKNSLLEMKRELYQRKLKEERIKMYKKQMKEKMEHKNLENCAKKMEYEQRLLNLDVADKVQKRKYRENVKKIMENRNIWNKQCVERKSKSEKERLEDRERLMKLQKDMKREDEEFLNSISSILHEFKKQDKNVFPIVKCVKEVTEYHSGVTHLPQKFVLQDVTELTVEETSCFASKLQEVWHS